MYICEGITAIRLNCDRSGAIFHYAHVARVRKRDRRKISIFRKTSTFPTNVNKISSLMGPLQTVVKRDMGCPVTSGVLVILIITTTSEIAISRVLRSVHCRLHTFFLDIDLARFDSKKLCVLSKI